MYHAGVRFLMQKPVAECAKITQFTRRFFVRLRGTLHFPEVRAREGAKTFPRGAAAMGYSQLTKNSAKKHAKKHYFLHALFVFD